MKFIELNIIHNESNESDKQLLNVLDIHGIRKLETDMIAVDIKVTNGTKKYFYSYHCNNSYDSVIDRIRCVCGSDSIA